MVNVTEYMHGGKSASCDECGLVFDALCGRQYSLPATQTGLVQHPSLRRGERTGVWIDDQLSAAREVTLNALTFD